MQNGLEEVEIRGKKANSMIPNPTSQMTSKLSESRLVSKEKFVFLNRGDLLGLGDIQECLELFLIVTVTRRHYWHLVGRDQEC